MRFSIIAFAFLILCFLWQIPFSNAEKSQYEKLKKIEAIIHKLAQKGAKIGCLIVDFENGQKLWTYHPDEPLIPASNTKLITTAVSLIRLGPNYRFKTGVYASDPPRNGVVQSDLYLKGFGDPFLVNEQMWILTHELALRGVKKIMGDIIADDTFFDQKKSPDGWRENRPPFWYNAEIGSLSFNFNTITIYLQPGEKPGERALIRLDPELPCIKLINEALTVDNGRKRYIHVGRSYSDGNNSIQVKGKIPLDHSIIKIYRTIKNPTRYTLMAFSSFLQQQGIEFEGNLKEGKMPEDMNPLLIHKSKPLSHIVADLNKISNNFIAEQILKTLGAEMEGPPGTYEKGLGIIKETLSEMGIVLDGLKLSDGSGLSSFNRIPARLICDLLFYMAHSEKCGPEFVSSLAINGLDGTLRDRPLNGKIEGIVRGKTGRIRGVSALSGYLWTESGKPLIFSILMNGNHALLDEFINSQDKILSILSTLDAQNMNIF